MEQPSAECIMPPSERRPQTAAKTPIFEDAGTPVVSKV